MLLVDTQDTSSRRKTLEDMVVGYAERQLPRTELSTDIDTDSDFESGLQMKLDNATNKKERKKLTKALNKQQKTTEKQKPYRRGDRQEQPLSSTVIQNNGPGVRNRRGEAFGNSSSIDVVNNDTLVFGNEVDETGGK